MVLVVDDEPRLRRVFVRWLGAAGYRCVEADCGEAAALLLVEMEGQIDLVVTDRRMPNGTGDELIAFARSRWPALPIVCVAACACEGAFLGELDGSCRTPIAAPGRREPAAHRSVSVRLPFRPSHGSFDHAGVTTPYESAARFNALFTPPPRRPTEVVRWKGT